MAAICRKALDEPVAVVATARPRDLVAERPSALFCLEREPARCHHQALIDKMLADAPVEHLSA